MIASLLAAAGDWVAPTLDYHALAPEIILAAGIFAVLSIDLFLEPEQRWITSALSGFVMLGALVTVGTLAVIGDDTRSMFGGRYVSDEYALILKALFLVAGYIVVLMSSDEIERGRYHQGEYYVLLLTSVLGMVMMASSRDLLSIFVALELLSIPAYMLAAWNKRNSRGNEAGVKYYLLGVFASAITLYGMSLLYGVTGTTLLTDLGSAITANGRFSGVEVIAVAFIVVGFAFKISAVPFHQWAPDVYEGAPTPITAFLSVASKAAGFVALVTLTFVAFPNAEDVYQPFMWVLAALSMTIGNLYALRQTNIVRMLAYSSVSQGGFILMPLTVAGVDGVGESALKAVVVYLVVYAATNLGAFAVVIAVARKTRSGEISSYGGLFGYAPALGVLMTIFLASLAGIPPLGGWFAKFGAFKAVLDADTGWGYSIAIIAAINTVISAAYYITVMREIWMKDEPTGDTTPIRTPPSLGAALVITCGATIVLGVLPDIVGRFGDITDLTGALGR
ncbi:MAG: NADH-quinone oxidoreductase subunit N [Acidimicrobiales bacterium]|nr:NADH-quinone oxidoreductase subunit N [Acidimicrobiales bacterium]MCB9392110.1 NADH-quinone oxidoreductase subunit N [Acidimicrobiaceae bacterium]